MNGRIAIFIHQPKCSIQSGNAIIKALEGSYNFKILTKHEVEDDFFKDVDLICVPGGFGDSDAYDYLMQHNSHLVKKFVKRGGKYLGICMGAYWADRDYFDILKDTRVVQYIKQSNSCTKRPHAKHMPINLNSNIEKFYFYDGCSFNGGDKEILATYSNGDPAAIIQNNVGLIGFHPEAEESWFNDYSWLRGKYNSQQQFLVNFVENLLRR